MSEDDEEAEGTETPSEEEEPTTKPAEVLDTQEKTQSNVPPQLQILEQYLPERDDYSGKTRLNARNQPSTLASISILTKLYPEIGELEGALDEWRDDLEKYLTSLEGASRDEFKQILQALLGVYSKQNKDQLKDSMSDGGWKRMFSSYAGMSQETEED